MLTSILSLVINVSCLSQDVEIIEKSAYTPELNVTRFDLIDDRFDLTDFEMVAKISGTTTHHKKNNLVSLFEKLWKLSNSIGANAYKADTIIRGDNTQSIVLKVYRLNKEDLIYNRTLYPVNTFYFLGDIRSNNYKPVNLKIHSEEINLNFLEYASCKLEIGQSIAVKIGKNLKSTLRIECEEEQLPVYYSFSKEGFNAGVFVGHFVYYSPDANQMQMNLGMFLVLNMVKKMEGIRQ